MVVTRSPSPSWVAAFPVPQAIITVAPAAPDVGAGSLGAGQTGSGSGGSAGDGIGEGEGETITSARRIRGDLHNSDLPRDARRLPSVRVGLAFEVQPNGHVGSCSVIRSSGFPELDQRVCGLIRTRYRFNPAHNMAGDPVTEGEEEDEVWCRTRREAADGASPNVFEACSPGAATGQAAQ